MNARETISVAILSVLSVVNAALFAVHVFRGDAADHFDQLTIAALAAALAFSTNTISVLRRR